MASFDRRTCKGRLNGPGAAEGNLCPEGWTFYPLPGPAFAGRDGAAEGPYYTWVDQHDILGLGANTPIGTGNFSDSLHALTYGKVVELRVPYPMGFFAKGVDGRIDDPDRGWKGKGLWVTSGNRTPMHIEGVDAPSPGRAGQDAGEPAGRALPAAPGPARALERSAGPTERRAVGNGDARGSGGGLAGPGAPARRGDRSGPGRRCS